jgi:thiol-disulfide isomerase/thioredoxin
MKNYNNIIKMFKLILILNFLVSCNGFSQKPLLPAFKITQANGIVYTAQQVEAGKPLLIVYFSPECDHCQVFMKSFFKSADDFKNTQVLFITYLPLDRLVKFGSEYPLNKYKNIVAGTEGMTFVVRNFYEIKEMPFAVVYNKNGTLVGKYEREIPLDKIIPLIK